MRLKWIVLAAVIIIVGVFFVLPVIAPAVTATSVLRDGQVAAGDTFMILNQSGIALTFYDDALATSASDSGILKKKGEALITAGRTREAGQIYRQLLSQNANDTAVLVRTGDLLYLEGDYTGALSYYDTALTFRPDDAKIWMREGDAYLVLAMIEEQARYDAAKERSKQSGTPFAVEPIESTESYTKAVDRYGQAMKLDPRLTITVQSRLIGATESEVNGYPVLPGESRSSH
jgi:tetratricopeptide (TPR) repeat protein